MSIINIPFISTAINPKNAAFIDFMLEEIYRALQKHKIEEVPNKVPNKSEITILKLLADKPSLTRAELAEQTGFSDSGIKKIINSLKSNNWIERHGSNKSGEWIVKFDIG